MAVELLLGIIFAALALVVLTLGIMKIGPVPSKIARIPATLFAGVAVMLLFAYYF